MTCRFARALSSTLTVLLCLLLHAPAVDAQQSRGTAVIVAPSDLQGLNALTATDAYTAEVLRYMLFLPLVRYDEQLRIRSMLAQSWTIEGDTVVVFRLRRDVLWHDGRRTTANDVAFTFRRAKDPRTGFPGGSELEHWLSVAVVDSFTVRFRIRSHNEPLAVWTTLPIMPAHRLASVPAEQMRTAPFNRAPVGNGPFRYVSHRANDRWVFEANPRFPTGLGGPPPLQRLIWRVVPDNAAQMAELLTGQADIMLAPRAEQVRDIGARAGYRGIAKPSRRYYFITWNGKKQFLADPRVRRALMMALDRQTMINTLRSGFAQIGTGPIAPYHWAFDRTLAPLPFDTAGARALLAAAGYRDRNGDGVVESSAGDAFSIELKVAANSAFNRDLGEMIRADLARVGVQIQVRAVDFATLVEDISSPSRSFDSAVLAFETDFKLNLRDAFHSDALSGPFQSASYSNPRVDQLLDRLARPASRTDASALWAELQKIIRDEQPWGVLWYPPELIIARERLQGFAPDIRGLLVGVGSWSIGAR